MIKLQNLNKYYKSGGQNFHALKDINLEFGEKGMNFILGKSGSGKSTLLNIIGGIDSYDSGELIIDSVNTSSYTKAQYNTYRNTYIGFIFQEFNVLKSLTVYENIAISLELQRQDLKQNKEKIQEIIDQVGLTGLENRMMNQLSGGQRQRVAIARSLIKNPRVIIADEPTGNLDSKNSKNIMDLLKKLSEDRLVIIVTHNDLLAKEYSDRTIEIKDGVITKDTKDFEIEPVTFDLTPISVPTKTSLVLSLKMIFKSLKRFIFMILLFSVALIFAGVVINMSLANTTLTYTEYQEEYNNNIVNLVSDYKTYGYNTDSAFYNYQMTQFEENYEQEENKKTFDLLKGMKFPLSIDKNAVIENEFYYNSINNIYNDEVKPKDLNIIKTKRNTSKDEFVIDITITDYVAENLIFQNYFGDTVTEIENLVGKVLTFDNIYYSLYIETIVNTNYEEHKENFELFNANASNDAKAKTAFFDNGSLYNAIFMSVDDYTIFFSAENIKYFNSDIVYNMVADTGTGSNVLFTTWPLKNDFVTAKDGVAPTKRNDSSTPIQVAVTTGFFEKILNIKIDTNELTDEYTLCDALLKKVRFDLYITTSNGGKLTTIYASNFLCMTSMIPANLTFNITNIVLDDNPSVYFAPMEETDDFNKIVSSVFYEGGFLTLYFNNKNELDQTEYQDINSNLYRNFIDNEINITNNSFTKVLLVDNFINKNLPLFIGVFFVFALFSVLLIFNFVIINIKNSTRDIGIYMSLGFSGWKISLIYLFQVIILGIIAYIISVLGTGVFLLSLDSYFTSLSSVNLSIIKMSLLGSGIVLGIALLIPILSVIIPLINLSRKNPVDVIKTI